MFLHYPGPPFLTVRCDVRRKPPPAKVGHRIPLGIMVKPPGRSWLRVFTDDGRNCYVMIEGQRATVNE